MFVTVTRPLHLRLPTGDVMLTPGHLTQLTFGPELVHRVLAQARDHVRPLCIESLLVWDSPLFGRCTGEVTRLPEGDSVRVRALDHSLIGDEVDISLHWITEVGAESD
jgi:hypothetical protein